LGVAERIVGIDIGTFSVKAAEVESKGSSTTLVKLGQRTLPSGAVVAGEVVDPVAVSETITELLKTAGIKTRKCIVGIGGTQVVVRATAVPDLADRELRDALAFQVVESLPIPEDELVSDYQRLGSGVDESGQAIASILLAGAHADVVSNAVEAVERAGLQVVAVDTTALADARALMQLLGGRFGASATLRPFGDVEEHVETVQDVDMRSYGVVDIGGGVTTLTLVLEGKVGFVRTLPVGGDSITLKLASLAECDSDHAEWLKRGGFREAADLDESVRSSIEGEIEEFVHSLVGEISSTLEYYLLQVGHSNLAGIWLTGGGSLLEHLGNALGSRLALPIGHAPMEPVLREHLNDQYDPSHDGLLASSGLTAIGLALRLTDSPKTAHEINLLPPKHKARGARRRQTGLLVAGGVLVVAALGGLYYQRNQEIPSLQSQLSATQLQLGTTQAQVHKLDNVAALRSQAQQLATQVTNDIHGTFSWAQLIASIAQATPADSWITQFTGTAPTAGAPGSVTMTLSGCSQAAPKNWLDAIGTVGAVTDPWVSSSALVPGLTGGTTCPGYPASGANGPQAGVTTYTASVTIAKNYTTSRVGDYINVKGLG
jgi:type IV pilus assembly protein PilM